jgi:hypothetical protein
MAIRDTKTGSKYSRVDSYFRDWDETRLQMYPSTASAAADDAAEIKLIR